MDLLAKHEIGEFLETVIGKYHLNMREVHTALSFYITAMKTKIYIFNHYQKQTENTNYMCVYAHTYVVK